MQTTRTSNDYARWIAALTRRLPPERAEQLFDFARFLLTESGKPISNETLEELSEAELEAEDSIWAEALARHASEFARLRAQAREDVKTGKTFPMFDEREISI